MSIKGIKLLAGALIIVVLTFIGYNQWSDYKAELEKAKDSVVELERDKIISEKQNKSLSEELTEKENKYLQSIEEVEEKNNEIEEKDMELQDRDSKIEKLKKDLQAKNKKKEEKLLANKTSSESVSKSSPKTVTTSSTNSSSSRSLGSFTVTSYAIGDGMTPGVVTANGTDVSSTIYSPEGYRIIAVDTSVIPMNSIVEVEMNGSTFMAKASDTGSAINGNKIDLLVSSPSEASSNGLMKASLRIVK